MKQHRIGLNSWKASHNLLTHTQEEDVFWIRLFIIIFSIDVTFTFVFEHFAIFKFLLFVFLLSVTVV